MNARQSFVGGKKRRRGRCQVKRYASKECLVVFYSVLAYRRILLVTKLFEIVLNALRLVGTDIFVIDKIGSGDIVNGDSVGVLHLDPAVVH